MKIVFALLLILAINNTGISQIYNVKEFGVIPDGKTINTEAIQKAIDECEKFGGGKVIFPAGEYLTGPLFLKSNVHIEIMAGAKIYAIEDINSYPVIDGLWEGIPRKVYASLFTGHNLNNISITGRGIIDGKGQKWWELALITKDMRKKAGIVEREPENPPGSPIKYRRPRVINLYNCKNILIRDVTILNSPSWTVHPVYCENVTIDNISIIQPYESPNTDGINPESCKNVRISDCFVDCGDDCVTIKSGYNEIGRKINIPCENIVITNCTFAHGRSAVGIGSETSGGVKNVLISNCVFQNTYRGLRIKTGRGRGNTVENIRATNIIMDNVGTGISIDMYYDDKDESKNPVDETTPFFKNIRYSHISGINIKKAGEIFGLPEAPVDGLTFEDVVFSAETGMEVKFVKDLSFREVEIYVQEGTALTIRDSDGIYIRNFCSKNYNTEVPAIEVENTRKAIFNNENFSGKPEEFLRKKGNNNEVRIVNFKK
ncbi:MAG: glycoside hydrolase family 28 protein [Bacteroidales bacterium]|nr:glycoside hydrolase family 28 protein [Bacteroidales bacterium]MCF8389588.1 glycoside hydrolase family 28 protein [Bacteroidales bacterium]